MDLQGAGGILMDLLVLLLTSKCRYERAGIFRADPASRL